MSVNQVLQALGSWDITLSADVPRDLLDVLDYFGHVAVMNGRADPRQYGDGFLTAARYVGVLRGRDVDDTTVKLSGPNLAMWLGDEDDKGAVIEAAININAATFANSVRAVLPTSVAEGTLYSVAGTYTHRHQWETPRKALDYICSSFSSGGIGDPARVEYRVNNNATLDAGTVSSLYVTSPTCVIVPKNLAGYDHTLTGLAGQFGVKRDVDDFTTRVVLMGEGAGLTLVTGAANIASNPYLDLRGNPVKFTRVISESDTPASSAAARAATQLAQFTGTNDDLTLNTSDYDIAGSFNVGDFVYAWNPDAGLYDAAQEITFRGSRLNPIALRVTETTWPVTEGMTVAYRAKDGAWYDLTDYVVWESGATSVKVGAFARQLIPTRWELVGTRPAVDTSVPAAPTLVTPFVTSAYADVRGFTRAKMIVSWSAPLNTDGSTILDGDHYEVRYAVNTTVIYPATWAQVGVVQWQSLASWAQPFSHPTGKWETAYAPWGDSSLLLQDLSPGVGYDIQIRAVDSYGNAGAWSGLVTAIAQSDNIPPSTPAAPAVAASRIAVQITHTLGLASGGTYNLESDLDHFDVHASTEPTFTPDATTRIGKLRASGGMIAAQIPAVGTFQLESVAAAWIKVVAVDIAGNASNASTAASATALLIDDAHISDLTVSKVTAGTITADWIVGARIKTADTGARVELNNLGLQAYNAAGNQTVSISAADGSVSIIGQLTTGSTGKRVEILPGSVSPSSPPTIRLYPSTGADYATIQTFSVIDGDAGLQIKAGNPSVADRPTITLWPDEMQFNYSNGFSGSSIKCSRTYMYLAVGDPTGNQGLWLTGTTLNYYGKWDNFVDQGAANGLFTGDVAATSGATSLSISYGTTALSKRSPIHSVYDNGAAGTAAVHASQVSASGTTGFTVDLSGAPAGGWSLFFWAFRV